MTLRYGQIAAQHWVDLDGYAVGHGLPDLRQMPLERFCHWVWWMLTRNAKDEAEREKLRAKIWRPPPEVTTPIDKRSPWNPENEMKAFSALKMQLSPGPPAPPPE